MKKRKGLEPFTAYPFSVRKPGESLKIINGNRTDEDKRRLKTRRSIEDMEAALRAKREEEVEVEGDW